jgi:hypothetical protein
MHLFRLVPVLGLIAFAGCKLRPTDATASGVKDGPATPSPVLLDPQNGAILFPLAATANDELLKATSAGAKGSLPRGGGVAKTNVLETVASLSASRKSRYYVLHTGILCSQKTAEEI